MIPADDRQLFKQAFSDHVDNLTPKFEIEHRLVAATRKGKWLSVKGKVVERDESDNPIRFIGRVEDITQRKLIEKRIHSALEKEKELLDLKSYFISKVSHEFRTPLATILSSIEILENYYPQLKDAEKEKQFVTIHNCIDDLIEMLTDVITLNKPDLANPEAGMVKLELIGYVSQLIENVKQSFSKAPQIVFLPGAGSFSAKMNEK
jgi:signal transduction histidine kinase